MGEDCRYFLQDEVFESGGGEHGGTGRSASQLQTKSPISGTQDPNGPGRSIDDTGSLGGLQPDHSPLGDSLACYLTVPCQIRLVQGSFLTLGQTCMVGARPWLRPCSIVSPTRQFMSRRNGVPEEVPGPIGWLVLDCAVLPPRVYRAATTNHRLAGAALMKAIAAPRRPAQPRPSYGAVSNSPKTRATLVMKSGAQGRRQVVVGIPPHDRCTSHMQWST